MFGNQTDCKHSMHGDSQSSSGRDVSVIRARLRARGVVVVVCRDSLCFYPDRPRGPYTLTVSQTVVIVRQVALSLLLTGDLIQDTQVTAAATCLLSDTQRQQQHTVGHNSNLETL